MEIAVLEEPQKKIFRARKTMKLSDRQQLEVLHHTLATTASGSPSSSSRPQTPLMNGTHVEKDSQRKETGTKSPVSPSSSSSPLPPISLSLSRSPSPTVAPNENPSPAPSEKKKGSEEGKGEKEKKVEKKTEEGKADKTETSKPVRAGSPSSSDKKSNPRNASSASPSASAQALNGEMSSMDVDSASLDHGLAEESGKGSSSSSSSPSGSPSAGLECDPEVKEGFLCLSEEEEGQGERDEVKEGSEEKMDTDKEEKKEAEKGGKEADSAGNSTPASKKRSLSPVGGKDVESKGPGDSKRVKVDGVELEAQLELKITAKASSRLKLEKVVQQLVEERIRVLQQTVFDRSLQELKERVEKMDATIKEQKALQHISMLNAKVARLSKKFGNANQALENSKKETAATPVKATATTSTIPATQCTTRAAVDPKLPILSPGSTSSTASPAQPKPLSTPITASSSALASTAPILQIISTTTSSTPVSSTASMSGQSQQGTLVLQTRPNPGVMTTSSASPSGQPMSIQPLLIQLPLPAGGVGLIPVSSLATVNNVNKAKTTTATTTFILQKAAGNVVSSSVPLSSSTTPQTSLARPAYQGGTATASSPSAAVSVTTARTPTQCAAVVGVATASSSPVATGPAATGSSAASTAPPSASKTDNQASNSTQSKTPAQPSRPKGSVIDLTEDDDDVQVTGVQKAPATPTATSTQRPLGAPPPLVTSTSSVRTAGQQRPSVDSPSKSRPASSSLAPLPPLPLAPSPPARLPPEAALTSPPQQPQLKLARVQSQNGIVLSWCVAETDRSCAPVDSYHLYAYHQDHQGAGGGATTPSLWKKIGEVKALPLPMACTLTQFVSGSTYYFAVRAKDVYGRFGPFCEPQCTDVINSTSSGTS